MTSTEQQRVEKIAYQLGVAAYLACLREAEKPHRTRRLGLRRDAYPTEYAKAAQLAVESEVRNLFVSARASLLKGQAS